ncbi:hypothetical protein HDV05_008794 [Chytridiales sp. JEL 0842]|nr:hypothetical protein HDV05_008794 [Chytridiales sp. JEL 0842]
MKYRNGAIIKTQVFNRLIQFQNDNFTIYEDEMNAYAKSLQYMQVYNEYNAPLDANRPLTVITGKTPRVGSSRPSSMDERSSIQPIIAQFAKSHGNSAPIGVMFIITPLATDSIRMGRHCSSYCTSYNHITKSEAGATSKNTTEYAYVLIPDIASGACKSDCRETNLSLEADMALLIKRAMLNILTNPLGFRDPDAANTGWRDFQKGFVGTICRGSYMSKDTSLKYPNPMKDNHDHNYYSKVDYQNHYNNDYNSEKVDYNNDHHQTLDNNNDYNSEKVDYNNDHHQTLDNNNDYNPEKVDYNNDHHQTLDNNNDYNY